MRTAGMALIELMMLFASIKAKDFQKNPTPKNMTAWCNAAELVDDPYLNHSRGAKATMRKKISA